MNIEKYVGKIHGTPAPGPHISVHTPMARSQRPLNLTKVQEYIHQHEGLNWDLFGYVKVMRFASGEMVVIDAQHRLEIVKLIAPHIQTVPAHIIDGTPESAALYFDALNGGSSSNLKSEETFWAKLCADDQFAKSTANVIYKTKWSVGKVNQAPQHRPAKYANMIKAIAMGEQAFLRACAVIDSVWPKGAADNLLSGMTRLFSITEYASLGDPDSHLARNFKQWLLDLKRVGVTPKTLEFKKYRNNGPWYDAVAYGLARHFLQSQRMLGRKVPTLNVIKEIWLKPVRDADDLESLLLA